MADNEVQAQHVPVSTTLRRAKSVVPEPVMKAVRVSARRYGVATAGDRVMPDFLVIGTKRGGTTSIWNALVSHPDCLPMFPAAQEIKSPHYFDINYGNGETWYRSHFPTSRQMRAHERRTGRVAVTGEASPYYMFHPLAAERIARDLPDVKLIVSLRDPVARAWSHYWERFGSGTESLTFEAAIATERTRIEGEEERIRRDAPGYYSQAHDLSTYVARGHYLEQIDRFRALFPASQLLILRAEDYYADPKGELEQLASFIGIAPFPASEQSPPQYNKLPHRAMADATRAQLVEHYREHVASLEASLGRSFDWSNFVGGQRSSTSG